MFHHFNLVWLGKFLVKDVHYFLKFKIEKNNPAFISLEYCEKQKEISCNFLLQTEPCASIIHLPDSNPDE